jgi:hypothetical protein
MNILDIQKTEEEVKIDEARRQAEYRKGMIISFASGLYVAYKDFWDNTTITPQEQCDLLGSEAFDLFSKHATGVEFILTHLPTVTEHIPDFMDITRIPNDKEMSVVDGKIIISDKIIEE